MQRVVIVADRDWLAGPSTDKRTIFAAMLAESVCEDAGVSADSMVAEVVDRSLGQQVKKSKAHPSVGYISSAELMALFTSQVVEHEDLNNVWHELLNVNGSEIYIKARVKSYEGARRARKGGLGFVMRSVDGYTVGTCS